MTPKREQTYFVLIHSDDVAMMRHVNDFIGSIEAKGGELVSVTRERDRYELFVTVVFTAPPGDDFRIPEYNPPSSRGAY